MNTYDVKIHKHQQVRVFMKTFRATWLDDLYRQIHDYLEEGDMYSWVIHRLTDYDMKYREGDLYPSPRNNYNMCPIKEVDK